MQESPTDEIGQEQKLKIENTKQNIKSMKSNWEKKAAPRETYG